MLDLLRRKLCQETVAASCRRAKRCNFPAWVRGRLDTYSMALGYLYGAIVALVCSWSARVIAASPVILWQVWLFFAPAVDPTTERKVLGLALFAVALVHLLRQRI